MLLDEMCFIFCLFQIYEFLFCVSSFFIEFSSIVGSSFLSWFSFQQRTTCAHKSNNFRSFSRVRNLLFGTPERLLLLRAPPPFTCPRRTSSSRFPPRDCPASAGSAKIPGGAEASQYRAAWPLACPPRRGRRPSRSGSRRRSRPSS